jgi:15-cis-phytoene synthase/lycopene beta-cyclase
MVDEASSHEAGLKNIQKLRRYLDLVFGDSATQIEQELFLKENFQQRDLNGVKGLPKDGIHESKYLTMLVDGLEEDASLSFNAASNGKDTGPERQTWPIATETDLLSYANLVAGTVAALCISLACPQQKDLYLSLVDDGMKMGQALQLVNIARDVSVDAKMGRVYLPTSWLNDEKITPEDVIHNPQTDSIRKVRMRVIAKAYELYQQSKPAMDRLPKGARGLNLAVESYMEIGRVLWERGCVDGTRLDAKGRATVPLGRRLRVALQALWSEGFTPLPQVYS